MIVLVLRVGRLHVCGRVRFRFMRLAEAGRHAGLERGISIFRRGAPGQPAMSEGPIPTRPGAVLDDRSSPRVGNLPEQTVENLLQGKRLGDSEWAGIAGLEVIVGQLISPSELVWVELDPTSQVLSKRRCGCAPVLNRLNQGATRHELVLAGQ